MLDENKHVLVGVQTASDRFAITDSSLTVPHNQDQSLECPNFEAFQTQVLVFHSLPDLLMMEDWWHIHLYMCVCVHAYIHQHTNAN